MMKAVSFVTWNSWSYQLPLGCLSGAMLFLIYYQTWKTLLLGFFYYSNSAKRVAKKQYEDSGSLACSS